MRRAVEFYLSLGSNVQPERNLTEAIRRLRVYGELRAISSVWESHAVGSDGPDFLNVCVGFVAPLDGAHLKQNILQSIETGLGRAKTANRNAPRTIDIDIMMEDNQPLNLERWNHAFVLMPMAELKPDLPHPISGRRLAEEAMEVQSSTWIQRRPDVLMDVEETKGN